MNANFVLNLAKEGRRVESLRFVSLKVFDECQLIFLIRRKKAAEVGRRLRARPGSQKQALFARNFDDGLPPQSKHGKIIMQNSFAQNLKFRISYFESHNYREL